MPIFFIYVALKASGLDIKMDCWCRIFTNLLKLFKTNLLLERLDWNSRIHVDCISSIIEQLLRQTRKESLKSIERHLALRGSLDLPLFWYC